MIQIDAIASIISKYLALAGSNSSGEYTFFSLYTLVKLALNVNRTGLHKQKTDINYVVHKGDKNVSSSRNLKPYVFIAGLKHHSLHHWSSTTTPLRSEKCFPEADNLGVSVRLTKIRLPA